MEKNLNSMQHHAIQGEVLTRIGQAQEMSYNVRCIYPCSQGQAEYVISSRVLPPTAPQGLYLYDTLPQFFRFTWNSIMMRYILYPSLLRCMKHKGI